jgi:hypothetical protein
MQNTVHLVPVTSAAHVAEVARMAHEVWNEYYVPIIGQAQVDYMVAKFQTAEAMQSQIDSGYEYFRIQQSGRSVGYAAIRHGGASHLWLTVNKGNPSVQAYERLGFRIIEALVMDIGGGYVMDDYKMEKAVA